MRPTDRGEAARPAAAVARGDPPWRGSPLAFGGPEL